MRSSKVIVIFVLSLTFVGLYFFSQSSMGTTLGHLISLLLKSPRTTQIDVDRSIKEGTTDPAVQNAEVSPEEKIIAQYYLDYLGREADEPGLKHYVSLVKTGVPLEEIRKKLEESEEAANFRARKQAEESSESPKRNSN